ncbi:terminase large subunit [Staphylococcus phage MVC_VPHSA2]|nr:terminase large subunit [Staphylococcus phage MVC_VPHSA2]
MSMNNIKVLNEGEEDERRYFGCVVCEEELNRENGQWVRTRPMNKMYSGYLFNQLNMTWISANQIWRDYQTMDAMTFANEVLGEFYSGDEQPITLEDVLACTDKKQSLKKYSDTPTAMGIDYGSGGKSKTIICIGHYEGSKLAIDHIESWLPDPESDKSTHDQLIEHICYLHGRFNVQKIVGDIGYGSYESQKLYGIYGRDAISCRYVTYSADPRKREYKGFNDSTLQVDRTYSMDKLINMFQKGQLIIPYKKPEDVEYFFDHWTAIEMIFTESTTSTGAKRYDHRTPDDAFHALNYVREALHEVMNRFEWDYVERDIDRVEQALDYGDDLPDW